MVFRRRSRAEPDPLAHVDPTLVPPRLRRHVVDALAHRQRYAGVVESLQPGPIKDRMAANARQVDAGVEAIWTTVCRTRDIERTVDSLNPAALGDQLKSARRAAQAAG